MADPIRVLSIDGGGIRGIIPALVLAEIERRTERRIADLFELIAGTSTGGLLALALARPGGDGGPMHTAEKLVGLYDEAGPKIFSRSLWQRVRSAEGLIDEKYDDDEFNAALERYLGDARLSDALTDVLVTAYETGERFPFFFKSARSDQPSYDFPMQVAARATSAAPTYFEAARARSDREYSLVDGGVFAVNPAMCAYAEVRRDHPKAEVLLLSLGTGELTRSLPYEKIKDWGVVEWARPVLDVVFDGVSDVTDYQLRQVLEEGKYWRLQTELEGPKDALDDASERNRRALHARGRKLISDRSEQIDAICERLAGG